MKLSLCLLKLLTSGAIPMLMAGTDMRPPWGRHADLELLVSAFSVLDAVDLIEEHGDAVL